jgi:hypothetical protein
MVDETMKKKIIISVALGVSLALALATSIVFRVSKPRTIIEYDSLDISEMFSISLSWEYSGAAPNYNPPAVYSQKYWIWIRLNETTILEKGGSGSFYYCFDATKGTVIRIWIANADTPNHIFVDFHSLDQKVRIANWTLYDYANFTYVIL